jgi:hypothetical protein
MAPATIEPGPTMTVAREGQAAVRLADGRVLMVGGAVPSTGTCGMTCPYDLTASVEVFDPGTGEFSANGSLAAPRTGGQALLLNDGRVLVSGGNSENGGYLETLEIYDPAQGTSVAVEGMPVRGAVVLLADGRMLVAGGAYGMYSPSTNRTRIFDPASGKFSEGPLMAMPRFGASATLLDDGRVLIVGGEQSDGFRSSANNSSELIDPSHQLSQSTWFPSDDSATASLLSDGRVLVTGWGGSDLGTSCNAPVVSEVIDPRTEGYAPVGPMSTPRTGSAVIKTKDGRVLVFGGVDSMCAAVDTVEAFDPDSETFQVIATGLPKISDFSLTLLDDGEILIAGGGDGNWNGMTAATWLLKP